MWSSRSSLPCNEMASGRRTPAITLACAVPTTSVIANTSHRAPRQSLPIIPFLSSRSRSISSKVHMPSRDDQPRLFLYSQQASACPLGEGQLGSGRAFPSVNPPACPGAVGRPGPPAHLHCMNPFDEDQEGALGFRPELIEGVRTAALPLRDEDSNFDALIESIGLRMEDLGEAG